MCLACEIYGRLHGLGRDDNRPDAERAAGSFVAAAGGDCDFAATADDARRGDVDERSKRAADIDDADERPESEIYRDQTG
jgi:hypothetical protein